MKILLLLFASILLGLLLRCVPHVRVLSYTSKWTVWMLLLVFGVTLGSNEALVRDFLHLGFAAFALAFAGVAGSVLAAWGVGRIVEKTNAVFRGMPEEGDA